MKKWDWWKPKNILKQSLATEKSPVDHQGHWTDWANEVRDLVAYKERPGSSEWALYIYYSIYYYLFNIYSKNDMKICEIIILYKDLCSRSIIAMLSGKNILANLKIWCSKMQPFSGNQRPDPVTSLMNMSPVLNLPRKKKTSLPILFKDVQDRFG